jgi:hypothetical protein
VTGGALSLIPPPLTSAHTTAAPPCWPPGLGSAALPSIARERWKPRQMARRGAYLAGLAARAMACTKCARIFLGADPGADELMFAETT